MNSKQLGRHRELVGVIVGPRRAPRASGLGGAGCLATLVLSSALAACTVSDPILDQNHSGVGGSVYPGAGGALEPGTGGSVWGVGGSAGPAGEGGADWGVGGAAGPETGFGGSVSGFGGSVSGAGGSVLGVGGSVSGFGGSVGPGVGGSPGVGGAPGSDCDQELTLFDCNARPECHAVFFDPGTCACSSLGCCAQFHHCASGFTAICTGTITCAVLPPHCESPYLISYRQGCYEGCVHYRDCPP